MLCIACTVRHKYILPISTVRIQLHVSALYVDHVQVETFNLQISYTRYVGRLGGWGERDLVVSVVGTMTPGHGIETKRSRSPHPPKRPIHLVQLICKLNLNLKMAHI